MKTKTVIIIIAVAAIVAILGGVAAWLLMPPALQPYVPEVNESTLDKNSRLFEALADAGLDEPVVDVSDERVLVRYRLLAETDKESASLLAMTVAATLEQAVPLIVVQVLSADLKPLEEASVDSFHVLQFIDGVIEEADFKAKVTTATF